MSCEIFPVLMTVELNQSVREGAPLPVQEAMQEVWIIHK